MRIQSIIIHDYTINPYPITQKRTIGKKRLQTLKNSISAAYIQQGIFIR